jgi:hypothetical protein
MNSIRSQRTPSRASTGASQRRRHTGTGALGVLSLCLGVACGSEADVLLDEAPGESAQPVLAEPPGQKALEFDVSEDMSRFVFAPSPVFEDGLPAPGNPFIAHGYLYPAGFLDANAGVDTDGRPAIPEQVVGEWTCRGWMVGDGAHTTTGPMVITTQHYELYSELGTPSEPAGTLTTDGFELADVQLPVLRAVTGGTGAYRGARGQMTQRFLGLNASEGVELRVQFDLD